MAPQFVVRYVPGCGGNDPEEQLSVDAICATAAVGCPAGQLRYWAYRSPQAAVPRVWTRTGTACRGATDPGVDGEEVVVAFTAEDFRRLPLPAAVSSVEPPGGQVLIGIETNLYATAGVLTLPAQVLGEPVTVRATPVSYTWDLGDGTTLGPTTDPGAPWPVLGNTHVYTAPGDYPVTLTTTYAGEYSVAGGPYLPIEGTATVASPAQPLVAHSARNHLVADTLR